MICRDLPFFLFMWLKKYFHGLSSPFKRNVSGLDNAKVQVKTRLQSMLSIFTFAEIEFLVAYGGRY